MMTLCNGIGVVLKGTRPVWGKCTLHYNHDGDHFDAKHGQGWDGPAFFASDWPEGHGNLKALKVEYRASKFQIVYPKDEQKDPRCQTCFGWKGGGYWLRPCECRMVTCNSDQIDYLRSERRESEVADSVSDIDAFFQGYIDAWKMEAYEGYESEW